MVVVFAFRVALHGVMAGHMHAARPDERVKVDVRRALKDIFRKKLTVDFDTELIGLLGNLNAVGGESENAGYSEGDDRKERFYGHGFYRRQALFGGQMKKQLQNREQAPRHVLLLIMLLLLIFFLFANFSRCSIRDRLFAQPVGRNALY